MREKLDEQIRELVQEMGGEDPMLKGIALIPAQKSLKFDHWLIPQDRAFWKCVFCKNYSIKTVAENEGMDERNTRRTAKFEEKMVAWRKSQRMSWRSSSRFFSWSWT